MAVVNAPVPDPTGTAERTDATWPEIHRAFPCSPSAVSEARRFVAVLVPEEDDRDVAALLVSELATNAVLHARTPFEVSVAVIAGGLRVEVRDANPGWLIAPALVRDDQENGRGLFIVASLASVWGYTATRTGKAVWFELEKGH